MYGAQIQLSPTVTVTVEVGAGVHPDDAQKNIIEACAFWQAIPTMCPMPGCGAPVHFTARHPKDFHYYGVICEGPKPHEMTFGERKDHTSLYIKEDGWKDAYGGGGQQEEPASANGPATAQSSAPAQTSPTGDKVDAGTVRMIQAVSNSKNPKPNLDGIAQEFFKKNLADCTKDDAMALLEYVKTL